MLTIKARLAVEDVPWNWVDAVGDISGLLEAKAGLADIIVLNTSFADHERPNMRAIVSDVILHTEKPILAVSQEARSIDTGGHALVAWNGALAIANALRAVTPRLDVRVIVVDNGIATGSTVKGARRIAHCRRTPSWRATRR